MKFILIILLVFVLCGCGSPKCTNKTGKHTFGKWSDTGNRRMFDDVRIMQRSCDDCGWIEEKLLN